MILHPFILFLSITMHTFEKQFNTNRRNKCLKFIIEPVIYAKPSAELRSNTPRGEILSIKGDKKDPFSRGHICPKALALKDVYLDKNRLKTPVKRFGDEWREISWEAAFKEIGEKIKEIQTKYGRDAVAVFQGKSIGA